MVARAHDLVELQPFARAELARDAPPWVALALAAAPFAVVCRQQPSGGHVAVGIRGKDRSQRWAASITPQSYTRVVTPEALCERNCSRDLPALRALRYFKRLAQERALVWGPTGSVGFELATGTHAVSERSDCDVLVRGGDVSRAAFAELQEAVAALPFRFDVEVELNAGALALSEIAAGNAQVLVKTARGPRLLAL